MRLWVARDSERERHWAAMRGPAAAFPSPNAGRVVTKVTAERDPAVHSKPMAIFSNIDGIREARLPLRFRVGSGAKEHPGQTVGISPERFIMTTNVQLQTGLRLLVS